MNETPIPQLVIHVVEQIDNDATAKNMRELRKSLRLNQGVIAGRMGVSVSYVSQLETAERLWTRRLARKFLDACYGVTN